MALALEKIGVADILKEMGLVSKKISLKELAAQWYAKTKKSKFSGEKHCLSNWHGESWDVANGKEIVLSAGLPSDEHRIE